MSRDLFGICPYATAQKALQGKWTFLILHDISGEPVRFNALLKMLPQMTHATLSKQLKQLEQNGLIIRTEYPQIPPRVEYSLSPLGRELLPVLREFHLFGEKYIAHLAEKAE